MSDIEKEQLDNMAPAEAEQPDEIDPDEEEYWEMIENWDEEEEEDDIPEIYYTRTDREEISLDEQPYGNHYINADGHIVVRNLSAWWLPEMKITEEIDGTIYTVTGSYDGTELLDQKLKRIMLKKLEDS